MYRFHWIGSFIFLGPMLGMLALTLLLVPLMTDPGTGRTVIVGLLLSGAALFTVAKLSVIRAGTPVSLGSARMTTANRRLYRAGWVLMVAGAVCAAAVLSAHRFAG